MTRKKRSLRRKITSLLLAMTLTALCFTGGASICGLCSMRSASEKSNRELGNTAAEDAEEALKEMAGEQLLLLAEEKAAYIEEKFYTVISCVNGIAQAAEDIYQNPEKYPDREVPLPEKNSYELAPQLLWSSSLMNTVEGNEDEMEPGLSPDEEQQEEILRLGNIQDLLVQYNRNNDMISSTYLATESGWMIQADYIPGRKYAGYKYTGYKYADDMELPAPFEARERQWYQQACQVKRGEAVYSDVLVDFHEGRDCIVCSRAVYDEDRIVAVAGVGSYLDTIKETVWNTAVGESGYAFLINQAGQVMISGAQEGETAVHTGNNLDLRKSENQELAAVAQAMLCGEKGLAELTLEGRRVYLAYAPLSEPGWALATVMDVNEALAPAMQSQQEILDLTEEVARQQSATIYKMICFYFIIIVLAAVPISIIGILFAGKMTGPIRSLTREASRIGRGNLDTRIQLMTGDEVEELGIAFNRMTSRLKKYIQSLSAATAEQERIQTELDLASRIQSDMLPNAGELFAERTEFAVCARMMPAKEVGGDFYDFFLIDNDRLAFLIADVSGKGVPASLFMVVAKTLLQSRIMEGGALETAVADVNERLCSGNENGMFVTAWIGVLTLSTGMLQYVNAGHNPPLIGNRQQGYSYITETEGFVLAGMEGVTYVRQERRLEPGDILFLYTDGVTETNDEGRKLYGEERLLRLLNDRRENEPEKPEKLAEAVMEDTRRFQGSARQFDDITILVVSYLKYTEGLKGSREAISVPEECNMQEKNNMPREISVPAQIEYRQEVQNFVEEILERNAVLKEDIYCLLTAFDELFSNICYYGSAEEIKIECHVTGEEVVLFFEDDGIPFHPWEKEMPDTEAVLEDRKEGGLGIYMVRELMDEVTYQYDDGKNKNKLKRKIK